MNNDLNIIKKYYGEEMMHLCRNLFPTLIDRFPGRLSQIMLETFAPERNLYYDLIEEQKEEDFKNFIYSFINVEETEKTETNETPKELLNKVGYRLYECHNENDIQYFKKYYAKGEELCTFNSNRLERCHVFFAVKHNVEQIQRKNFPNPKREDKYGTSVISIQFTKDGFNMLSIKNRYNHSVNNPDATFSNNLDNIILGLTDSFEKHYGLKEKYHKNKFYLNNYVLASNGKNYKYNYEINNKYYCTNNIILDNFEVKEFPKEKYIVADYFIIDLENKNIKLYDNSIKENFHNYINNIKNIQINKINNEIKEIFINSDNMDESIIKINNNNQIISFENKSIKEVNYFLTLNKYITSIYMKNLIEAGENFLYSGIQLSKLQLPKIKKIGNGFLFHNKELKELNIPTLEYAYDGFLNCNKKIEKIDLPNLGYIGNGFLFNNNKISLLNIPKVKDIRNGFLKYNNSLKLLYLPKLEYIGNDFLHCNKEVKELNIPTLKYIGNNFLYSNRSLKHIDLPNIECIWNNFLYSNTSLTHIDLPKLKYIGNNFLYNNKNITKLNFPNVESIGDTLLYRNNYIKTVNLPKLKKKPLILIKYKINAIIENIKKGGKSK